MIVFHTGTSVSMNPFVLVCCVNKELQSTQAVSYRQSGREAWRFSMIHLRIKASSLYSNLCVQGAMKPFARRLIFQHPPIPEGVHIVIAARTHSRTWSEYVYNVYKLVPTIITPLDSSRPWDQGAKGPARYKAVSLEETEGWKRQGGRDSRTIFIWQIASPDVSGAPVPSDPTRFLVQSGEACIRTL